MYCWTLGSGGSVVDLLTLLLRALRFVLLVLESSDRFLTGWELILARCKCSVKISCYLLLYQGFGKLILRIMEWRGTDSIQARKPKMPFYCPGDK